jgi:hypothetical protein
MILERGGEAMARETDEEFRERMRRSGQREPVKFEAGQVVRATYEHGPDFVGVLSSHRVVTYHGPAWHFDGEDQAGFEGRMEILSHAPRAGDTWSNGESVVFIHGGDRMCIVGDRDPFLGDVVAVARKLWEGGYRRANPQASKAIDDSMRCSLRRSTEEHIDRSDTLTTRTLPFYLTLDDLKSLVPTHEEQMRSTDAYQRTLDDAAVQMTRLIGGGEEAEKLRAAQERRREMFEAAVKTAIVSGMSVADLATEIQRIARESSKPIASWCADGAKKWMDRGVLKQPPQSALDGCTWTPALDDHVRSNPCKCEPGARSLCVLCATGDDLRNLAELYGVPVLRAGVVVRAEDTASGERSFGVVVEADGPRVFVRWSGESIPVMCHRENPTEARAIGRWRIVTPDVRPLASLANAVAAVFARPDIATSRRFIDLAVRGLRGEPFAAAVAAALVAAGDAPLSPHQIAALVRGARAHEARRSEVAPARRTLTPEQLSECFTAGMRASQGEWFVRLSHVYERARTA